MKRALYIVVPALILAGALHESPAGESTEATLLTFSEGELRAIRAHGPWPLPPARDPSNRVSGRPEAMDLGEHLFFDRRLSASGQFSCSSCHVPDRGWTDNRERGWAVCPAHRK